MASDPAKAATVERTGADPFYPGDLSMGQEQWIDVDGVRTRYFDQGSGAAMALFHGGYYGSTEASTARTWDRNFQPLSKTLNVVAVDRLGQGYTDAPRNDAGYTIDAAVQHAANFLTALNKGPYHLVGHSTGGYLVARLALEYPHLARTVTCASGGALSPGYERYVHANLPAWSPRATLRACYERLFYDPRDVTEQLLDEPCAVVQSDKFIAARTKMAEGLERTLFRPELGRQRFETQGWLIGRGMPCPTLLTWGLQDPVADVEDGKVLLEMFMKKQSLAEGRFFNRAGHYVHREHAASFSRTLHAFATSHQ